MTFEGTSLISTHKHIHRISFPYSSTIVARLHALHAWQDVCQSICRSPRCHSVCRLTNSVRYPASHTLFLCECVCVLCIVFYVSFCGCAIRWQTMLGFRWRLSSSSSCGRISKKVLVEVWRFFFLKKRQKMSRLISIDHRIFPNLMANMLSIW